MEGRGTGISISSAFLFVPPLAPGKQLRRIPWPLAALEESFGLPALASPSSKSRGPSRFVPLKDMTLDPGIGVLKTLTSDSCRANLTTRASSDNEASNLTRPASRNLMRFRHYFTACDYFPIGILCREYWISQRGISPAALCSGREQGSLWMGEFKR
jgi:hypothetical protein